MSEKRGRGKPRINETDEILAEKIEQYFKDHEPKPVMIQTIDEDGEEVETVATDKYGKPIFIEDPPTVAGLAYYLGYESRQSMYDLRQRKDNYSYLIKRAILKIESNHEKNLSVKDKPTGSIFFLKNHNWADKQEIEHSGSITIIDDI